MPTEEKFDSIMDEQKRLAAREDRLDRSIRRADKGRIEEFTPALKRLAQYQDDFDAADEKYGLPSGTTMAVAAIESRGRADIITGQTDSSVGAAGIMQFMPKTARSMGLEVSDSVDERNDPIAAIDAGAKYVARQLKRSDGDMRVALAKYNWGSGNWSKWESGKKEMPDETSNYIGDVMGVRKALAPVGEDWSG